MYYAPNDNFFSADQPILSFVNKRKETQVLAKNCRNLQFLQVLRL